MSGADETEVHNHQRRNMTLVHFGIGCPDRSWTLCRGLAGQTVALLLMGLPQFCAIWAAVKLPQVPAFTKALMMQSFHCVSSSWLRATQRCQYDMFRNLFCRIEKQYEEARGMSVSVSDLSPHGVQQDPVTASALCNFEQTGGMTARPM